MKAPGRCEVRPSTFISGLRPAECLTPFVSVASIMSNGPRSLIIFRPSLPGTRPPDHMALMGIVVPLAAGVLGSVTVRSPFLNAAVTLLPSTPTGSRTLRVKAP
jgi:hypothetical protein